ncbi:hypothetical protein B0H13DRAFT_1924767 [Mycena leptocephala]|nr:hypothetical protein B0H13DRAFT_1924767 [Mycena leptocephala]
MANIPQAPAGTGVASFKVPRPWESNVPKFTTEDKEDLQDFIEQVNDIITLAQITDEEEMKRLLTSYLPAKKREIWRALPEYAAGTSFVDFKKAVLKAYPELKEDLDGTLEEFEKLCAENKSIKRGEEGRLKRFGMRYRALVKKLSQPPAIILNKEACRRYLDALERGFAETLRMAINTRNLIKEDLLQLGGNAPVPAAQIHAETTWGEDDEPEYKRSDRFSTVKIERRDARIDELGRELSGLQDALIVAQKQSKAAHEELLKAFQNSKSTSPAREDNEQRDIGTRNGPPATYGPDRQYNRGYGNPMQRSGCYYCDGQDHFSKECTVKAAHIHKGWIVVEDGQQKLADGGFIPRGKGPAAVRVEEYWQRKSTMGQHFNESSMVDEVRTLRVKLNQVQARPPPSFNQPAPTMQMQAQVQPFSNQAAPAPAFNMEELGRTVFNMMKMGGAAQDQIFRAPRKEVRTRQSVSKPLEGNQSEMQPKEIKEEDEIYLTVLFSRAERRYLDESRRAYELKAPVQREGLADELLERINNTEVTVKLGDLFGMSKDLREGEKLQLTRVRQQVKEQTKGRESGLPSGVLDVEPQKMVNLAELDSQLMCDAIEVGDLPEVQEVFVTTEKVAGLPAGSVVAQDPYLQYLEGLGKGEEPKQIYVARDSVPLRVTFPYINSQGFSQTLEDLTMPGQGEELAFIVGFNEEQEMRIEKIYQPRGGLMTAEKIIEAYVVASEDAKDMQEDDRESRTRSLQTSWRNL